MTAKELHKLVNKNDTAGIEDAFKRKNNVNQQWYGSTLLMAAASLAQDEMVHLLLQYGAIVNTADRSGLTALMFACMHGYDSTAEILIRAGADANMCDNKGWTPLHHASYFGLSRVIKVLLSHKTTLNAITKKGLTALDFTIEGRYVEAALLLQWAGLNFEDTSLARTRKAEDARKWLEQSAPALHAVQIKEATQLENALAAGTDVNTRNENGFTLLMLTVQANDKELAELLLRHGADVDAYAPCGWTALQRAANGGHTNMVDLLLEHGATVHPPFDTALSAIASAAWSGHVGVVEKLLASASYAELENALFQAERHHHTDVVNAIQNFKIWSHPK